MRGSADWIVDTLEDRRRRLGISYVVLLGADLEAVESVVMRLAGT